MRRTNVEIKARCRDLQAARDRLAAAGARLEGTDLQTDTYFRVPQGRLKLREGNIENALIFYRRPSQAAPKRSDVLLHPVAGGASLKAALAEALGVRVVVRKRREIYRLDNLKLHVDEVEELGTFVEIEAIDADGQVGVERLTAQCGEWMDRLGVREDDLVDRSYADLLDGYSASGSDSNSGTSAT